MPSIHVYVHEPKAALLRAPTKDCGCTTRDSDTTAKGYPKRTDTGHAIPKKPGGGDGEGKWVTINGAAVHIGEGGKIDKGPKELMDKSEHEGNAHGHRAKAGQHRDSAQRKGAGHPDSALHRAASNEHGNAAMEHENAHAAATRGDMGAARKHAANASEHATKAAGHESRVGTGKGPEPSTSSEKPAAHKGLHSDAGDDVKGSEKHEAEHKRLLKEYDKSKSKWERDAVNNLISKNAQEGSKANAQTKTHKALQASEHAKGTGDVEHHRDAVKAIDAAHEAHDRAGGEGSGTKKKELLAMRKQHEGVVAKHDKANPEPTAGTTSHFSDLNAAREFAMKSEKPVKVFHKPGGGYFVPQNAGQGSRFEKAGHKPATDYMGRPTDGNGDDKDGPTKLTPRQAMLREQGSPRYAGRHPGSTSALAKIAAKHAKKAAEDAADQDPKHKK